VDKLLGKAINIMIGGFFMIRMINPSSVQDMENPHGVSFRKLYDGEYTQFIHINLLPGEKMRKHIAPVDAFFYILEGTGVIEIGEERIEVSAEAFVESPANIHRYVANESDGPFRFLMVKALRP
jgi:mannose-6-phosphate isomerase-like protein (cupin superfamily)